MAQNGKVNPDGSYAANPYHECTETGLRKIREAPPQKNKKSSDYGYPSKVRASSRSEKKKLETETNEQMSSEAVSTEKHIQDVMDSEAFIACLGDSPLNTVICLGIVIYLAATQEISLPAAGFLILLFFIFHILYARPAAIPRPDAVDTNAAVTDASFQNDKDDCEP
ncbi:hypothetical protein QN277_025782 [Acacia crassicarpa]|uniref:Uncharacterized protein n=1 Tax=Acacia crassicarpa TaxID=499986 RepID=A0AAE1J6J6_9FABA|nr:hypothetical protein QN277_025782 [Acacia crassicarpa]